MQYFTTLLNKQKNNLLSGLVRDVDEAFLTAKIKLPTRQGKIDFAFIDVFIAELEAYLLATGLKDYILTPEEEKAIADFESGQFEWSEFKIEDILQWQPQKEIDPLKLELLKDETEMMYPFYGQSTIK